MKDKIIYILVSALTVMLVSGCSNTIPELDNMQQEMVVEYAAGVVLKHNQNSSAKLITLKQDEQNKTEDESIPQNQNGSVEDSAVPDPEGNLPSSNNSGVTVIDNTNGGIQEISSTENESKGTATIQEYIGIEGMDFRFTGYEVDQFYPNSTENLYFVMNATDGNQLLVLKFDAENISQNDLELNMVEKNIRYKIKIDDKEINALTTTLPEDMAYYQGTIAAGDTVHMVLVCEINNEKASALGNISVVLNGGQGKTTIELE